MTLVEFLLARIAEDEATARKLLRRAQEHELSCGDPRLLGREIPGWHDWPEVQRVTTRVLAECESKRRIVVNLEEFQGQASWEDEKNVNGLYLLRLLALPYADHPDYGEAWRP